MSQNKPEQIELNKLINGCETAFAAIYNSYAADAAKIGWGYTGRCNIPWQASGKEIVYYS